MLLLFLLLLLLLLLKKHKDRCTVSVHVKAGVMGMESREFPNILCSENILTQTRKVHEITQSILMDNTSDIPGKFWNIVLPKDGEN
jgi:hypothetical protein